MINKVELSGRLKNKPIEKETKNGPKFAEADLMFFPYEGATKEQWVKLIGWKEMREALLKRTEGEEMEIMGNLQISRYQDNVGMWQTRVSVSVLEIY